MESLRFSCVVQQAGRAVGEMGIGLQTPFPPGGEGDN